jgi:hypothetical protein
MHSIMSVLFRKLDPAFSATASQQCLFADEGQELSQRLLSCYTPKRYIQSTASLLIS